MRLAVDTNRYTDFRRGDAAVRDVLERATAVLVPFIVVAELRVGFAGGNRQAQNEKELEEFLVTPGVTVLYADDETTRQYCDVYHQLRRQGTPIPSNDMWIAALVMQHGLTLYARDAHFDHLPQIPRL